jgi:4-amino-4-deoxy-L-arabinose transferase-like glycosyltransferase
VVLWGGWLLTGGVFFSIAGFFHEYYLSMLAPALAALVGIGIGEVWRIRERYRWLAATLLLSATAATLWLQFTTASAFVNWLWWRPFMLTLFAISTTLLVADAFSPWHKAARLGFVGIGVALLLTPGIWSGLTMVNSSANQSLPAAYDGRSAGPANRGSAQINQALLAFLESNTQNSKYLMAVPSSMQGSDYVIATERPVLYLGGFMGQDQVVTSDELAQLVAAGELRYIYWDGRGGFGAQSSISRWVTANCVVVRGFDTQTQNSGAPDGTRADGALGNGGMPGGFGGNLQVSLYDCKAK